MSAGLYVHVPFCAAKCPYCHFYSEGLTAAGLRTWREGLKKEAEAAAAAEAGGLRFDTLYLGGGTPSLLGPEEVAEVRSLAGDRSSAGIAEFTLEANPCGAGAALLGGWRDAGVTRLSVGVQSFDEAILRTLGRPHSAGEALRFCRAARDAGFDVLAVDLMTGIPGETAEGAARTVRTLLELELDHVSLYFLENVEGLPFEAELARRPVDEDAAVEIFSKTRDTLQDAGLRQYEISNFARPGKECRHNLKYWRYEPFLGLGPSACSHIERRRWSNRASLGEWSEALERGQSPRAEVVELDAAGAAREALVFGLRLVEGVDLRALGERLGIDIAALHGRALDGLTSDGLLIRSGGRVRIPADKLLVSNAILSRL
jgi:oxygen-independent coproporphyrinogen-3 oxidase